MNVKISGTGPWSSARGGQEDHGPSSTIAVGNNDLEQFLETHRLKNFEWYIKTVTLFNH